MTKKIVAAILAVVLIFALVAGQTFLKGGGVSAGSSPSHLYSEDVKNSGQIPMEEKTESKQDGDIVILYTNDVHCAVDGNPGYTTIADKKRTLEALGVNVVLVDAGDFSQGDVIGALSSGKSIVSIMNETGYDLVIPGNHEFDYGVGALKEMEQLASFPIICCNFVDTDGNTVFCPYEIKEVGGIKLGFVGAITPMTLTSSVPASFRSADGKGWAYGFCQGNDGRDFYDTVQRYIDEVREKGADYVILLSHLGVNKTEEPYTSTSLIANTCGINLVIDGHSHTEMEGELVADKNGNPVLLTQTGSKLSNIGMCDIRPDGTMVTSLMDGGTVKDLIDDTEKEYDKELSEIIANSSCNLYVNDPATNRRIVRIAETNLGDLVCDALRDYYETDIAICNGGGIRADIPAGSITLKEILTTQPYYLKTSVIDVTGRQIADALELSCAYLPAENGGFLQVSGLSFTVDLSVESEVETDQDGMLARIGDGRRVKDIMIGDEPLNPDRTYTLAATDFLVIDCGNGFSCFRDCNVVVESVEYEFMVTLIYLRDTLHGIVGDTYSDPYGSGRIKIING